MTLQERKELDRLAEIAMQGLCSVSQPAASIDTPAGIAEFAYRVAESMLAERKRRRER
jgi:hypothetical protein